MNLAKNDATPAHQSDNARFFRDQEDGDPLLTQLELRDHLELAEVESFQGRVAVIYHGDALDVSIYAHGTE